LVSATSGRGLTARETIHFVNVAALGERVLRAHHIRREVMHEIKHFMTEAPHAIGHDQTLKLAHERMLQWGIHHLPVLDGGELVGVLSERDIALVQAISPKRVDEATASDAMSTEPYAVEPSASLESVAAQMAEHQYGCAVVMDHHKVLGVFTPLHALGLLAALLHETQTEAAVARVLRTKSRAPRSSAPKAKS